MNKKIAKKVFLVSAIFTAALSLLVGFGVTGSEFLSYGYDEMNNLPKEEYQDLKQRYNNALLTSETTEMASFWFLFSIIPVFIFSYIYTILLRITWVEINEKYRRLSFGILTILVLISAFNVTDTDLIAAGGMVPGYLLNADVYLLTFLFGFIICFIPFAAVAALAFSLFNRIGISLLIPVFNKITLTLRKTFFTSITRIYNWVRCQRRLKSG